VLNIMTITYTNWRGERGQRRVVPMYVWHGTSGWHEGAQWFMRALDVERETERDFALSGIDGWPVPRDGATRTEANSVFAMEITRRLNGGEDMDRAQVMALGQLK
jgi:predicted DNA-binding transcriptional regulator YafY